MNKLIGSAPSVETLKTLIDRYFYSNCGLIAVGDGTYEVHNSKGRIDGCIVTVKRGRYRLEMIKDTSVPDTP